MATTKLEVWNKALVRIGGKRLRTEDSDSQERWACERAWTGIVSEVLRAADWNFARHTSALVPVASTPLQSKWTYEFRYPTQCEMIRRIYVEDEENPEPYEVALSTADPNIRSVFCNIEQPLAIYTYLVSSMSIWDAQFADAVAWKLASDIALILTQSGSKMQFALQAYYAVIREAKINNIQEGHWRMFDEIDPLTKSRL